MKLYEVMDFLRFGDREGMLNPNDVGCDETCRFDDFWLILLGYWLLESEIAANEKTDVTGRKHHYFLQKPDQLANEDRLVIVVRSFNVCDNSCCKSLSVTEFAAEALGRSAEALVDVLLCMADWKKNNQDLFE